MTSLSLLLFALSNKIKEYKIELTSRKITFLSNLDQMLVYVTDDESTYIPRLTSQKQRNNKDDYFKLLFDSNLYNVDIKVNNLGNRRTGYIYKLYQELIENYVEERCKDRTKEVTVLYEILNKIKDTNMVAIEAADNKQAYMLLESLNNRGLPLSAIDLIKNNLINLSDDSKNPKQAKKCYEQWGKIFRLFD